MLSKLRNFIIKVTGLGIPEFANTRQKLSARFIISFYFPLTASLLVLIMTNTFSHYDYLAAIVYSTILIALTVNVLYLVKSKNLSVATFVVTFLALIFFTYELFEGVNEENQFLWFLLFPFIAYYLNGIKKGSIWLLVLFSEFIFLGFLIPQNILGVTKEELINPEFLTILFALLILAVFQTFWREFSEGELETSEADLQKFKLATDNTYDQVVITDSEGIVLYGNPAVERITGYKPSEALGKKAGVLWGKLMPHEYFVDFWNTIKNKKKPYLGEIQNKRKDGTIYTALISVSPVLDNNGKILYFVAIERDITKEKDVDRMKTEFVSLASHQLRTPLTSIKWYLEMILDETVGTLTTEQKQYLKDVYESNEAMIALVNSLLNISRIESGRLTVAPEPTDIGQIVANVLKQLEPQIVKAGLNVSDITPNDLPKINIDPALISHVFMNLLTNSIKYTRSGGKIEIRVQLQKEYLLCSVSDTGIGIPNADKSKIFSRFFRGSNVSNTTLGSTGLGLYLAQKIVEISGGRIWFESEEGNGTVFYFTIPLSGSKEHKGEITLS